MATVVCRILMCLTVPSLLQKLYKFINCVELVSPHHSAKELVNNLRTGQIMGLFQKSVKRVSGVRGEGWGDGDVVGGDLMSSAYLHFLPEGV